MPYLLLQGPNGQPVVAQGTVDGKLVIDGGGGGGGDATLAEQQTQTGHLSTIALACDVPTSDVVAAIEALGATATIADVVGLLTTDAAAQANILAKLTEIGVNARTYCAKPRNDAATLVTTSFVIPALNSNVQISVLNTSGFATGTFVDNATNDGVFCGGRFWDIVSIDSSTQMTVKLRNAFGAVVTMIG